MGDCGCFGQLIPITPIAELIKNLLTIGLLIYLFKNVSEKPKGKNNYFYLLVLLLLSALFMFLSFPFCPCEDETPIVPAAIAIPENAPNPNADTTLIQGTLINDSINSAKQNK